MKVVYVAGPFRAKTAWGVAENVRAAERVALQIARLGAMPLCPHANTAHFDGECTANFWLEGTLELLRRCDAAVFIHGWPASLGSMGEWEECGRLSIPRCDLHSIERDEREAFLAAWIERKVLSCA